MDKSSKIILPGGAGLVGQNLLIELKTAGYTNLVVIDKHKENLKILSQLHHDVLAIEADLSTPGSWEKFFEGATVVIMLQAQIGALRIEPFLRNNVESTKQVLKVMEQYNVPQLVHISSSVVNSVADDFYTRTKKEQEMIVSDCSIPWTILRPTLMYGWFDRKHLGWLSRFMAKVPFFPVPGHGKYMRQPLYVMDFCRIIISAMEMDKKNETYNITGRDEVDYIDIIREIKNVKQLNTRIIRIPYSLFYFLLWFYGVFSSHPPFTTQQLKALVAHDRFELIPWWDIFSVEPTDFSQGMKETFSRSRYSDVVLEF